jgi:hypothetical protein
VILQVYRRKQISGKQILREKINSVTAMSWAEQSKSSSRNVEIMMHRQMSDHQSFDEFNFFFVKCFPHRHFMRLKEMNVSAVCSSWKTENENYFYRRSDDDKERMKNIFFLLLMTSKATLFT